jgi:hypothetical protein
MNATRLLLVSTGLFALRTGIGLAHGHAHQLLAVPLAAWQNVFVQLVIFWGPLGAMLWLWVRRSSAVAWSLTAMLVASWLFGMYFHFGPPNPDHVSTLPHGAGHDLFRWTAAALLLVEPLSAIAAALVARSLSATRKLGHA